MEHKLTTGSGGGGDTKNAIYLKLLTGQSVMQFIHINLSECVRIRVGDDGEKSDICFRWRLENLTFFFAFSIFEIVNDVEKVSRLWVVKNWSFQKGEL